MASVLDNYCALNKLLIGLRQAEVSEDEFNTNYVFDYGAEERAKNKSHLARVIGGAHFVSSKKRFLGLIKNRVDKKRKQENKNAT